VESIPLIVTIVVAAVGATWALRTALGGLEAAFKEHAAQDAASFKEINNNVVQLKARQKRR
jgi:hypothetical protein